MPSENGNFLTELNAENINVLGVASRPDSEGGGFFVYVNIKRDGNNRQIPSNKKLSEIREGLKGRGVSIEFLLSDEKTLDIELGLRATLLHHFGDYIRNVFTSTSGSGVGLWIEPKKDLQQVRSGIESKASLFLSGFGLELVSFALTVDDNLPSSFACLKALRKIAPVEVSVLLENLKSKKFTVPSTDWLERKMESMRKDGLCIRMRDGRYALTAAALQKLGTIKGRMSPDIERLLAIARAQS